MAARRKRFNPVEAAVHSYRVFHGQDPDPDDDLELTVSLKYHSVFAGCGELVGDSEENPAVVIRSLGGELVRLYDFGDDARLAMNEERTQLYFVGGDQSVDLKDFGLERRAHDFEVLGYWMFVQYHTTKVHLRPEDGGTADYRHKFGGNGKRLPMIGYDVMNDRMLIMGGDYTITPGGIVH